MKKNLFTLSGTAGAALVCALALAVLGAGLAGCEGASPGKDPANPGEPINTTPTETYTGSYQGAVYTLAETGDAYTFTVSAGGATKISTGSITDRESSKGDDGKTVYIYTLKPSNSATTFAVVVGADGLYGLDGVVTFSDNTTADNIKIGLTPTGGSGIPGEPGGGGDNPGGEPVSYPKWPASFIVDPPNDSFSSGRWNQQGGNAYIIFHSAIGQTGKLDRVTLSTGPGLAHEYVLISVKEIESLNHYSIQAEGKPNHTITLSPEGIILTAAGFSGEDYVALNGGYAKAAE